MFFFVIAVAFCRGLVAEERCTGNARHAFFELQGLKYEATERYVGKTDRAGKFRFLRKS